MIADNFVFEGSGFVPLKQADLKALNRLNVFVLKIVEPMGYTCRELDPIEASGGIARTVLTFHYRFPNIVVESKSFAERLHLKSSEKALDEGVSKGIRSTVAEVPFQVTFTFQPSTSEGSSGFNVRIRTEAMKILKMRRFGDNSIPSEAHYQTIVSFNKRFILDLLKSLMSKTMEEPKVLVPLEHETPPLFDESFLASLPTSVTNCLVEANGCFESGLYAACSVMLRKAIETALTIKYIQLDESEMLTDEHGYEAGLDKKLKVLPDHVKGITRETKEMEVVKWFGDRGAHDFKTPIFASDIRDKVVPRVQSFLAHLSLKK